MERDLFAPGQFWSGAVYCCSRGVELGAEQYLAAPWEWSAAEQVLEGRSILLHPRSRVKIEVEQLRSGAERYCSAPRLTRCAPLRSHFHGAARYCSAPNSTPREQQDTDPLRNSSTPSHHIPGAVAAPEQNEPAPKQNAPASHP